MSSSLFKAGRDTAAQVARIGVCGAILFVVQIALAFMPNCELVTCLTIVFTLAFGPEMLFSVTIFSLLEGMIYGFGLWVISYLYVWPILVLLTLAVKKWFRDERLLWAVLAAGFGLIFGSLFAIAYIPVDPSYALSYWIAGLMWDAWHAFTNGVIVFLLYTPLSNGLGKIKRMLNR